MKQIKIRKKLIIYISIAIITVLLNVVAWNSTAFCDAYIAYIFPIWVNTYGRLTGIFPFSVGEWLLVAGVVLVVLAALAGVVLVGCLLWRRLCATASGVCKRLLAMSKAFYSFFAWAILVVCVIMTLNCSILYHATTFSENYFGEDSREYSIEDLIVVYNYVAERCNELCQRMERAEDGTILYHGFTGGTSEEAADMADKAIEAMQQLGQTYPQLDGYYPSPKPMMFSDFMCQQYMCGYFFPFSMEANYNDVMYVMNKPATFCHELAHLRGYIFEDEANFIAYLACVESEDEVFQYAGYLSVLNYLLNDLYKAMQTDALAYEAACQNVQPISMYAIVQEDNVFVTEEEWERINGKALIDTETVDEVSDTFTDTTLKLNGVSDGMISYSRVVKLLLQYYAEAGML